MSGRLTGQERDRVAGLMHARLMSGRLSAAAPSDDPRARWQVVDAKYLPGVRCLVLYESGDRLLCAELPLPTGGVSIHRWNDDPALPGLHRLLAPGGVAAALGPALARVGGTPGRLLAARAELIRYRPGRRCTLRITGWLRDGSAPPQHRLWFGKVYHDAAKAAAVWEEGRRMHTVGTPPPLRLAAPVAYLPEVPMVVQEAVTGDPLDVLVAAYGRVGVTGRIRDGVRRAGEGLAALHAAAPVSARVRPPSAALVGLAERVERLSAVDPVLAHRLGSVTGDLASAVPGEVAGGRVLVHGDCKPAQFRVGPAGVALLDLDHSGIGHPAEDLGCFLASLRQLALRLSLAGADRAGNGVDDLVRAFVDGYLDRAGLAGRAADRERLLARARRYEAVALVRKALRASARAPRSPLPAALTVAAGSILHGDAPGRVTGGEGGRPWR